MKSTDAPFRESWNLEHWDELEAYFRANRYDGSADPDEILHITASGPYVFSAPHAINHFRDGQVKIADRWTGSLSLILGHALDSSVIVPLGPISDWTSWDDRSDEFVSALRAQEHQGRIVIDLHGMSDRHNTDLCIGLGPEPSPKVIAFAEFIIQSLPAYVSRTNDPFTAQPSYTVTSFLQTQAAVDACQFELAARLRDPANPGAIKFAHSLIEVLARAHGAGLA